MEGHTARLTGAEFCPHYTSTLVTISEDRTFKVISNIVIYNFAVKLKSENI